MSLHRIINLIIAIAIAASFSHAGMIQQPTHTGIVSEVINGKNIIFIQITEEGDEYWIALAESDVHTGEKVRFKERKWIENFGTKALERTFEIMLLVSDFKILPSKAVLSVTKPSIITIDH